MARNISKVTRPKAVHTLPKLTRVAAYARVSSGKDAMLNSLSAQVSYYSELIQKRSDWQYAGVYADEAVSGTKDNRAGFNELLVDCRAGKIDIVITKSISRFARNTVTLLETVRELKSLGIGVLFERENIYSLSGDGELMLTILASFAQEESLSVSENCKWRIRDRFKQGEPNNGTIFGYRLVQGKYYIMPEEAEIVQQIFSDYLGGMGRTAIAQKLNAQGYESRLGKPFAESSISVILRNEKYVGNMLLQKTFIADHISKKKCVNRGELPMYFIENSHEAIVDSDTFQRVQDEITRRALRYHPAQTAPPKYPFTGMIRCGCCGSYYRRKHASAGSKYEKIVWICNTFNSRGKSNCPESKQIPEDILKAVTAEALGIDNFDENTFTAQMSEIKVPEAGRLIFIFKNGSTIEKTWQNPSRSLSWDADMRKRQGEQTRRRYQ
ncbi:MAG: recombinase family protein [Clostridiales bacterium]|nr:recombinase family protein [Clostridiales bacterium]